MDALTRTDAEEMTKDELVRKVLSLETRHGHSMNKFTPGRLAVNYLVAPAVGVSAGEAINYGLTRWAGSGKFGSGFVTKYLPWLKSGPHVLLGGVLAATHVPSTTSSGWNDAVFSAAASLAIVGVVRLAGAAGVRFQQSTSEKTALITALNNTTGALQQANARLTGQPIPGPSAGQTAMSVPWVN